VRPSLSPALEPLCPLSPQLTPPSSLHVRRSDMIALLGPRPYGDAFDDAVSFGSAAPEPTGDKDAPLGHGIEGGLGGGIGNEVPSPKGIDQGM